MLDGRRMNSDVKLMILIPCRGTLVEGLVKWLWGALPDAPFPVMWDTHHGRPEDDVRNRMVKRFLADERRFTHLMMIDDDIIPPPNALEMALHGKEIVSAVVFTWTEGAPLALVLKWNEEEGGYNQDKETISKFNSGERLLKLPPKGASGTGCFVVKREVYENLVGNWFRYRYDDVGILSCGEDLDFYQKVHEVGYSVWIDGAVLCGHIGQVDILEVQRSMAKQQQGGKNENIEGDA